MYKTEHKILSNVKCNTEYHQNSHWSMINWNCQEQPSLISFQMKLCNQNVLISLNLYLGTMRSFHSGCGNPCIGFPSQTVCLMCLSLCLSFNLSLCLSVILSLCLNFFKSFDFQQNGFPIVNMLSALISNTSFWLHQLKCFAFLNIHWLC